MNTAVEKIHILAAEQGSLEDVLGPLTDHQGEILYTAVDAAQNPETGQTEQPGQAPFPPEPVQTEYIAHIDAVDRQVDHVPPRGPIDVRIGSSHVKNPA